MWVSDNKATATVGDRQHTETTVQIVGSNEQRASARERHKDRPTEGHATNGVEQRRLDELAQRKRVGIHKVHRDNKWMGSLNFGD